METFIVVQVYNQKSECEAAIDYPQDFPIPNTGDELIIKDEEGFEHWGIVIKKKFRIREYRELTIILKK